MNKFFKKLWSTITGRDATLRELSAYAATISKLQAEDSKPSIALSDVIPWQDLGNAWRRYTVWSRTGAPLLLGGPGNREMFRVTRQERVKYVDLSIHEVQGIGASKSTLSDFTSISDMADARCGHLMSSGDGTLGALVLLARSNVRLWVEGVPPRSSPDNFVWHQWDGRVFFSNVDGSHHFAAAQTLAQRAGADVTVGASMLMHTIKLGDVMKLLAKYDLFYIGDRPLEDGSLAPASELADFMDQLQAPWGSLEMPGHRSGFVMVLPRDDASSVEVAQVLRSAGVTDVGTLLSAAAMNQVPMFTRAPYAALAQAA